MVSPAWALLQGGGSNNALGFFQLGANMGQSLRARQDEQAQRNALAAYATNPGAETLGGVMQADPRLGIQLQAQEQQRAALAQQAEQQQAQQRRADLPTLSRLLDQATDDTSYQRSLAAAREYGVDVSKAPAQFDPEWIGQQKMVLQAMQRPELQEALSTAGKQAADEGFRPGSEEFNRRTREIWEQNSAIPYTDASGATRLYIPGRNTVVDGPAPGAVENGYRFKGGNPADPSAWEEVGGPTQPASGGFPGR